MEHGINLETVGKLETDRAVDDDGINFIRTSEPGESLWDMDVRDIL